MFDFRRITLFCLEKRLSKHKLTIFSKNLGVPWLLWPPPGYAYVALCYSFFSSDCLCDRILELHAESSVVNEELVSQSNDLLRINTRLRPMGSVSVATSHQLVVEFVDVVRDLNSQLTYLLTAKNSVSYITCCLYRVWMRVCWANGEVLFVAESTRSCS